MGPCGCDELIFNERCIEKSKSIVVTTLRPPDLGYLSAFSSGSHLAACSFSSLFDIHLPLRLFERSERRYSHT
jgi:hypothetical protein